MFKLKHVGNVVNKTLGLLPAKAGIGYRLSVDLVLRDFLAAVLEIALYHKTLDYLLDVRRMAAAMKDLFCNSYLLEVSLSGV